ncbi:hypothetical protein [Autumnicola musiva]|uniref:Glycosyl hydrolase family 32 N-terminal domain-containing protein n=1 Tax=Autumnicola musiva TaxID=3075589 RepID=A0ABU3D352_9FLAO|nr:hypothetical protein [Zunongwangia sp. F117]MDT0675959.1 hypothetical protein [Zunongwangia sp. F117]
MMEWIKKGMFFNTDHNFDWMISHACVPTVHVLNKNVFRIFFAPRNKKGQSELTYVDVDSSNPKNILGYPEKPIMPLGKLGAFDDGGIMPCSVVPTKDGLYLYYVGWNPSGSVPYRNSIGLAVSKNNGESFHRMFEGPIVDRNPLEPYFTASPYVMQENNIWHMWYASSTGFVKVNGKPEPLYIIKYASSEDGITWKRENLTCIKPKDKFEANARASVIKEDGVYKMWFAYRGSFDFRNGKDSYRIGYAESWDAVNWERMDHKAGISFSENGWDSKMQTYPNVIVHNSRKYLFYNGNGFGETGIGYAVDKN